MITRCSLTGTHGSGKSREEIVLQTLTASCASTRTLAQFCENRKAEEKIEIFRQHLRSIDIESPKVARNNRSIEFKRYEAYRPVARIDTRENDLARTHRELAFCADFGTSLNAAKLYTAVVILDGKLLVFRTVLQRGTPLASTEERAQRTQSGSGANSGRQAERTVACDSAYF